MSTNVNFTRLCLTAGGIKGFALLGMLNSIYGLNLHQSLNTIIGSSIGSLIGGLLSIGYSPKEILFELLNIKIFPPNINFCKLQNFGLLDQKVILNKLKRMIKRKSVHTLNDVYNKFNIRFISVTINLNTGKTEYLDYLINPNMPLLTAISLSIRIPYLYRSLKHNNNYYIDGGLTEPFPISYVDDGKEYVMGLCFNFKSNTVEKLNFIDYTSSIFKVLLNKIYELSCKDVSNKCLIIPLNIEDYPLLDFKNNDSIDLRLKLYAIGSKFILDEKDNIESSINRMSCSK